MTGGAGFVGRRLTTALADSGQEVISWTRADADLTDPEQVAQGLAAAAPNSIFHLAAAAVSPTLADDAGLVGPDVIMAANLTKYAPAGARIILGGTMSEYGAAGRLVETQRCQPRTAYAIAKHAASLFALAYGPRRGLEVCATRIFGVYGPGEGAHRFFPSLVAALQAGKAIDLSDGRQNRDFVHVDDVCGALMALARCAEAASTVVNLGTGQGVRVADAAAWIADDLGADRALLNFGARPRSPGDEDNLEADTTRLIGLVGAAPPQRLAPGLDIISLMGAACSTGAPVAPIRSSESP